MTDITALIATELSKKQEKTSSVSEGRAGRVVLLRMPPKILLQLNSLPFVINTNEYKNAQSAANPTGDYKAAYRFSLLADAIPVLSPKYISSLNTLSKVWGNIINSANSENAFTKTIIDNSSSNYRSAKMFGLGGIPEDWYTVTASPSNWCELLDNEENLLPLEIDLLEGDKHQTDFLVLNDQSGLNWKITQSDSDKETALNSNSTITKISMNVLRVDFHRSWLDFELFDSPSWKIEGLDQGYFSTGDIDGNDGIMPLIPQGFLVGNNIKIEGNFSSEDIQFISQNQSSGQILSLGNFVLQEKNTAVDISQENDKTVLTSKTNQIIGFISRIVPLCPPVSGAV